MRIYGKTLPEIFSMLPFAYKMVVIVGTCFFVFALPYSLNFFFTVGRVVQHVEPVQFPGLADNNIGVLDPAMASDGQQVILAHTVIDSAVVDGKRQLAPHVVFERAVSPCRSWMTMNNGGFPVQTVEIMGPDSVTPLDHGSWVSETPGIVYDPDDKGQEWKAFAYKYYWIGQNANNDGIARLYSVISMRSATDPSGNWTPEQWLFSASASAPPPPYGSLVPGHINSMSPQLADVYFYSRPSVVYSRGALFMSLSAFTGNKKTPDRVIMLASTDHGKSWVYIGTPIRQSDVSLISPEYTTLAGATLLVKDNKILLAAVLGGKDSDGLGTFLIDFKDPTTAELVRDEKTTAPIVLLHAPRNSSAPSRTGGGFAAYADICKTGMLVSEFSEIRRAFQIFKTYKQPVAE
ncbi:MAG: hypothetical protein PW788_02780 [Micavibrio sp.]|nr:hypothetical protein [Micavibrio sp.]